MERFPTDANGKMLHSEADYVDTWPEMEKLVQMGLVRSIGISNFNSQQIERVLKVAKIKPVVNQVIINSIISLGRGRKNEDLQFIGWMPSLLEPKEIDGVLQEQGHLCHRLFASWFSRPPLGQTGRAWTSGRQKVARNGKKVGKVGSAACDSLSSEN